MQYICGVLCKHLIECNLSFYTDLFIITVV